MKGREDKHVIGFKTTKLKPDEKIVGYLEGWIGDMMGKGKEAQHNGQFIVTDKRACFYRKGLLGEVFETIPLTKVTSVETLSRMGYRVLRLHTSHDELAFKTFESKELFDKAYCKIEELRERKSSELPASTAESTTVESIPEQIKKIAELYASGILTEDEFQTKKSQLLDRM